MAERWTGWKKSPTSSTGLRSESNWRTEAMEGGGAGLCQVGPALQEIRIQRSKSEELVVNISFENKVALVTGAGSGLGLATARAFAESGASVVLADWNEKTVHSAAEELAAKGHKTLAIRCDVADDAQVEEMVRQTVATFGQLDAAYNNAGIQNVLAETADSPAAYGVA